MKMPFDGLTLLDYAINSSLVISYSILFPNKNGGQTSPRTIQHRLSQWTKKQGLGQNVNPHMLRHSFATHLLQSSSDLRAVQEMLGHESITTTEIYTHLNETKLRDTIHKFHPRA